MLLFPVRVWLFLAPVLAVMLLQTADPTPPTSQPAASQPTSPATPAQAEIYRELLREQERSSRILPTTPGATSRPRSPQQPQQGATTKNTLLLEGTLLVDRPGRLLRVEGRSVFRLNASDEQETSRTMELNKNGLLEAMEREAESGSAEFYITAVVSRYRGKNYLTLLKYRRQVSHRNLSP